MRPNGRQAGSWRAALLALLFVACALSGLAAGVTTRAVAGGALTAGSLTIPGGAKSTPTHTPAQPSPSATTPPATIVAPYGFSLSATVTPRSVAPGQPFTVTVTVVAPDGSTPRAGVECDLGAAPGSPPLFASWPAPVVSDATGQASWSLTVPATAAPGSYALDISAHGARGWRYDSRPSLTISG